MTATTHRLILGDGPPHAPVARRRASTCTAWPLRIHLNAVVLDSGERVHLLGVRTLNGTLLRAVECLREMVLGKKGYLPYDGAHR